MESEESGRSLWLRECKEETLEEIEGQVKGTIPLWMEGRVIRNGPGTLHVGKTQYHHLFDSLALLHQFNISSGKVFYSSRFLGSDAYQKNMAANRIVITEFGTTAYPDPCAKFFRRFKNTLTIPTTDKVMSDNCSINVCQVRDEMFALTESCYIRQIDPKTLKTIGGKKNLSNHIPVNMLTAHPHIDRDGTLYNIGSSFTNPNGTCYSIVKMPDGRLRDAKVVASIPSRRKLEPSFYHSFAMTENYWVFIEQPLVLHLSKIIEGSMINRCPAESIKWLKEEDAFFRIVERSSGRAIPVSYKSRGFCTFYHVNAWEEDGQILLDICGSMDGNPLDSLWVKNIEKSPDDPSRLSLSPSLLRFVLPVAGVKEARTGDNLVKYGCSKSTAIKQNDGSVLCSHEKLCTNFFNSPRINYKRNGKPYRYAYGVGGKEKKLMFEKLFKIDVKTGETTEFEERGYVAGEPIFVQDPDGTEEDDGVIISTLLKKGDPFFVALLILNARDMKELGRAEFKTKGEVTQSFHGQYIGARDAIHSY
uniref:EcBCO-like5 n=1 Tax=Palaemon carinicauda TaxID=392227 RepID=A0A7L7S3L0_PALCI|nr:EcBCO-like5 [Palaemon carinicauda]